MDGSGASASRSIYLELLDERQLVREGYDFLDEKRLLLANRLLALLGEHARLGREFAEALAAAGAALAGAVGRHGIEQLWAHPGLDLSGAVLRFREDPFLGLGLPVAALSAADPAWSREPVMSSPEAADCARRFLDLLRLASALAAMEAGLRRLEREYRRTERRAKALENVLLPEIDATLAAIEEQLEALQQEEGLRVRHAAGQRRASPGPG